MVSAKEGNRRREKEKERDRERKTELRGKEVEGGMWKMGGPSGLERETSASELELKLDLRVGLILLMLSRNVRTC